MVSQNLINIGSDNGLSPDGSKPLPVPMLTNHQLDLVAFICHQFCSLKVIDLRLEPHLPGANELIENLGAETVSYEIWYSSNSHA